MTSPRPVPVLLAGLLAGACAQTHDDLEVEERASVLFDAPAEPPPAVAELPEDADLQAYVDYGLRHHAGLRAAYERWRAAVERIAQTSSLPDPEFSFKQFIEEVQTRTGPQKRVYALSQAFPWFGTLDRRADVARGAAERVFQDAAGVRLEVERDIAVAYHDYGYLGRARRITADILELLQRLEPVVQRRIATGLSGQDELLRLQVEIGRIENDLESLDEVRPALSASLAAAMSWPRGEVLPLPELTEPELVAVESEAILERAFAQNPSLRGAEARVESARSAVELAGLAKFPDFKVGVDYIETGSPIAPTPDAGNDPFGVSLMFSVPIWRGRYAAAEREAERDLAAARFELVDRREHLRARIERAVFELSDAGRQLRLYRDTLLPRAREALDVTRAAYRAGDSSLLDLIDSERALLEFETAYWRACRDHGQSRARLAALVGGSIR